MKYCRACKVTVPDRERACPRCKSDASVAVLGGGGFTKTTAAERTGATTAEGEALQFTLGSLERRLEVGKRRSLWLFLGAIAAVIACIAAWSSYHASAVMSYAELDTNAHVERDPFDPDRVVIVFRPTSEGKLGFGRSDRDRETELIDRVAAAGGSAQRFQWRWAGVKTGDKLWVTYRGGWSLHRVGLAVPEPPPRPRLGNAVLMGEVVDATTNQPIAGAEVRIIGTSLRTKTTPDGRFTLKDAPAQIVGIEASAADYSTEQFEKELSDTSPTRVRAVLSPGMKAGQIRMVLTWDDEPKDLDAHLTGPLPGNDSFHVYFGQKGDLRSKEFVSLDVDDRDGAGPETITVLGVLPGKYRYFVHDYSNSSDMNNTALARSGAQVKVYQGGQTYRFHVDGQSKGNLWNVCEIDVTGAGAVVTRVDEYESKQIKTAITSVDVVFVMDTTGSMGPYIEGLKRNCIDFAETVAQGQRDCRLGLIGFGDVRSAEPIHVFEPTDDARLFQKAVRDIPRTEGGDEPESSVDALERAMQLTFRQTCVKVLVLITDASCHRSEAIPDLARNLRERGFRTHIVAPLTLRNLYDPLCAGANNGKFHAIRAAKFDTLLQDIAEDVKRYLP